MKLMNSRPGRSSRDHDPLQLFTIIFIILSREGEKKWHERVWRQICLWANSLKVADLPCISQARRKKVRWGNFSRQKRRMILSCGTLGLISGTDTFILTLYRISYRFLTPSKKGKKSYFLEKSSDWLFCYHLQQLSLILYNPSYFLLHFFEVTIPTKQVEQNKIKTENWQPFNFILDRDAYHRLNLNFEMETVFFPNVLIIHSWFI